MLNEMDLEFVDADCDLNFPMYCMPVPDRGLSMVTRYTVAHRCESLMHHGS
jgi:hypothetical protein